MSSSVILVSKQDSRSVRCRHLTWAQVAKKDEKVLGTEFHPTRVSALQNLSFDSEMFLVSIDFIDHLFKMFVVSIRLLCIS